MTGAMSRAVDADIWVLVVNGDAFEAGYITATLAARGLRILGPCDDAEAAMQMLDAEPGARAAIVGRLPETVAEQLAAALRDRRLPCLRLLPGTAHQRHEDDVPMLAAPFAAYQVADWVADVLAAACPERLHVGNIVRLGAL